MIKKRTFTGMLAALALITFPMAARLQTLPAQNVKAWIIKSNSYTQLLIDLENKYSPEDGSSQGLAVYDTKIAIPTITNLIGERKEKEALMNLFSNALKTESDESVRQDLQILIAHLNLEFREQDFELHHKVTYLNPASMVYDALETLLDDQNPPARHAAAVIRLRKYAGLVSGFKPIAIVLQERTQLQMKGKDMIYPTREEIELGLSRNSTLITGIADLFKKYKLTNWEQGYAKLKQQIKTYDLWIRMNILPKARKDFRLSDQEYALQLEQYGIDIPSAKLATIAHAAFNDIQAEMKPIAEQIAKQRHLQSNNYRDVIRSLKKEQVHGDSIIPLYKKHLRDIEEVILEHHLITLPNRAAIIRLGTAAETAQIQAPHLVPPPFLNNTGERGVFVLPLNMPGAPADKELDKYDDFTFDAASWTMIAHEARPGHELQFDKMVEEGVSEARSLYAFNSTNVEGWGLYAEYMIKPYMPLEGQLLSLDYRLFRAARAFLDPELQAGKITRQEAMKVLLEDVVQSPALAREELERYTIQSPGQANSYFYGFIKMLALRKETEAVLGTKFDALKFHDFILSQGLLTPALLREAVLKDFIPAQLAN
ncbi:MAG: DUF885 domain-containing protein [Mucilaginibacter sp.]